MNKKELIENVATAVSTPDNAVSKTLVERVLYAAFNKVIANALAEGEEVSISDFGKFGTKLRPARVGRNPQTGVEVEIPEKVAITFKPATALKNLAN